MKAEYPASPDDRRIRLAALIRNCYPSLREILPSPYVDGEEVHRALQALGNDVAEDGPELVGEVLGWKCMRLPVANLRGKPKHYLPLAMPKEHSGTTSVSSQVADYVRELREFAHPT